MTVHRALIVGLLALSAAIWAGAVVTKAVANVAALKVEIGG